MRRKHELKANTKKLPQIYTHKQNKYKNKKNNKYYMMDLYTRNKQKNIKIINTVSDEYTHNVQDITQIPPKPQNKKEKKEP